jgi:hypothetical protein
MANSYTYFQRTANVDSNSAADINALNANMAAIISTQGTASPPITITELNNNLNGVLVGAASALSLIETKSNLEYNDIVFPLSTDGFLNESFADDSKIYASFATAYSPSVDGTRCQLSFDKDVPSLPISLVFYSTASDGNVELATIIATYNTGSGYSLSSSLSTAYAAGKGKASTTNMMLSGDSGQFNASLSGNAALNGYHIKKKYLGLNATNVTMEWAHRWNDDSYPVSSFDSSTATIVTVDADYSSYFATSDAVWLYNRIWNGIEYNNRYDSVLASNAKRLTLASTPVYNSTAGTLEFVTNETTTRSLADNWRIVREPVSFQYRVGTDGTGSFTEDTPSAIIPFGGSLIMFEDDFNRANSQTVGNNWGEDEAGPAEVLIDANALEMYRTNETNGAYRSLEGYTSTDIPFGIEVRIKRVPNIGNGSVCDWYIGDTGGDNTSVTTLANSLGVSFDWDTSNLSLYYNASAIITASSVITSSTGDDIRAKIEFRNNHIRAKVWNATIENEPGAWDIDYTNSSNWVIGGTNAKILWGGAASGGLYVEYTYFAKYALTDGFITKGNVTGISGNILETMTYMSRNATASRPTVLQRDAVLEV